MADFIPPSPGELEVVEALKQRLLAEGCTEEFTDIKVLRFLRGRKGDVEKALRGLQKHVEWRAEYHVDEITAESIQSEMDTGRMIVNGFDKNGRPIINIIARRHHKDRRDLNLLGSQIIYTLETVLKNARPDDERMCIVFDLSGFGMYCMDYEAVKLLISILQFNYPETLSVAYIVNSPMLFTACWAVIKPWLDPVTAAKCRFAKVAQLEEFITIENILPEILDSRLR